MSHDQCHSTVHGEKQMPGKAALAATPRALQRVNGQASWRSMDEVVDSPEFREQLEREFPSGMAELVTRERLDLSATGSRHGDSRREFLKLMGASVALAGAAATLPGCRRPEHKIYAYGQNVPEEVIPGKPLYYTTSMARWDGGAEGLLVETHEGRPTKIEGNPLHSVNNGKVSSWALASIMSLYDPDRLKFPAKQGWVDPMQPPSWDNFRVFAADHFKRFEGDGAGLAFLVEKNSSPTRAMVRDRLLKKFPNARWIAYAPSESVTGFAGTKMVFGKAMREVLAFSKDTRVVVSLDHDFLQFGPGELPNARGFAISRAVEKPGQPMSRLYAAESAFSITGGQADHRMRLSPSRVTAFACMLAKKVLGKLGNAGAAGLATALAEAPKGDDIHDAFVEECANDLLDAANRGRSVVTAGPTQPAFVHALAAAMNAALENVGKGVSYIPVNDEWASDSLAAIGTLTKDIEAGKVTTLVCVNTNPAYDAPGDCQFPKAMATGGLTTVTLSVGASETADLSTWALNGSHFLESWGDTRAIDGTVAPVQPMIAPLYDMSMSDVEFLALLAGKDMNAKVDGYELVRECWQGLLADAVKSSSLTFDVFMRRCLHNGVVPGTAFTPESPKADFGPVTKAAAEVKLSGAPTKDKLEVVFGVGNLADGRFANVGWLQELPAPMTRVVWDNPVLVSPKTAMDLGLAPLGLNSLDTSAGTDGVNAMYDSSKYPHGRVAEVKLNGRMVKAPVWVCPGLPDNTAVLTLGYGRTSTGLVGDGVGSNFYALRDSASGNGRCATGCTLADTGEKHMIASTQNHWTIDSKTSILRAVDLPAWDKHGGDVQHVMSEFYGTKGEINFAEKLGELSHMPPSISSRVNPFNGTARDADKGVITPGNPNGPKYQQNQPPAFTKGPQWGMAIDQTICTGCGTCTIACQAENNIAVVGKKETAKGREMAWIRVDRYFAGDDFNNPSNVHHQPVACVHCENAPCEVVCPVNATVHGPEGLNYMTYNRCIGTRYCANNCPYKVRRYNWFDYGVTKFNGGYAFKDTIDSVGGNIPGQEGVNGSTVHNKINPNLIPPRLRQKLDEISKMQKNPDVTVRSRGVMEKCTYCVQRINAARIDAKLADLRDADGNYVIPEGFVQTACQQACPSNAIVFGDILDKNSRVHAARGNARSYALLGYLNTRPRTSHMLRVMNPNRALLAKMDPERLKMIDEPFHHGGAEHGGAEGHGGEHAAPEAKHSFFDNRRRGEDGGYALSLRVLSGGKA